MVELVGGGLLSTGPTPSSSKLWSNCYTSAGVQTPELEGLVGWYVQVNVENVVYDPKILSTHIKSSLIQYIIQPSSLNPPVGPIQSIIC